VASSDDSGDAIPSLLHLSAAPCAALAVTCG
jgi:hypothetical protein